MPTPPIEGTAMNAPDGCIWTPPALAEAILTDPAIRTIAVCDFATRFLNPDRSSVQVACSVASAVSVIRVARVRIRRGCLVRGSLSRGRQFRCCICRCLLYG